jgi:hypothetical protein
LAKPHWQISDVVFDITTDIDIRENHGVMAETDGPLGAVTTLIRYYADDIKNRVASLAEEIQSGKYADQDELQLELNMISTHFETGFRNLSQDIASLVDGKGKAVHHTNALSSITEKFQKQVELISKYTAEYTSAVKRSHVGLDLLELRNKDAGVQYYLGFDKPQNQVQPEVQASTAAVEVELKAALDEIARLKSARETSTQAADTADLHKELELWKETAERHEENFNLQKSIIEDLEAEKQNEQAARQVFMARFNAVNEDIASLRGAIRVMCRIKPEKGPSENKVKFTNLDGDCPYIPWQRLRVTYVREGASRDGILTEENKDFEFTRVFGTGESNQAIFDEVRDFAQSATIGRSSTVMAYGSTGTGKTHTFLAHDGLVPSYMAALFQIAEEDRDHKYSIQLCAVEIYLKKVYDLLQEPVRNQKVEVRMGTQFSEHLDSEKEALDLLIAAVKRRTVASTRHNDTSSRSHFVISLKVSKTPRVTASATDKPTSEATTNFVDLAGSEPVGKNGLTEMKGVPKDVQDLINKQGQDINESLFDLGQALKNLGKFNASHPLARYLRPSLTPDSRILLLVTVSSLSQEKYRSLASMEWVQQAVPIRKNPVQQRSTRKTASSTSAAPRHTMQAGSKLPVPGAAKKPAPSSLKKTPIKPGFPTPPRTPLFGK